MFFFLETLLAARDRVTLSYIARDALTGEPLQASTVVACCSCRVSSLRVTSVARE